MSETVSGRALLATLLVCSLVLGGCLTLSPTVSADTNDSAVFEDLSPTESWSASGIRVNATLKSTSAASNVTSIAVIQGNGRTYETVDVASGQSTVILTLPPNANATLVASNSVNSTTIGTLNVTTGGNEIP
jgi:predicted neuraminidase